MTDSNDDNSKNRSTLAGNAEKDPDDWVTDDEKMTGAQASYLQTLYAGTGELCRSERAVRRQPKQS